MSTQRLSRKLFVFYAVVVFVCTPILSAAEITLVDNGKANASIVTAKEPTISARLAALELQYHIEKITGARLPIKTDAQKVKGNRILVGESPATRKLGLKADNFPPQEYLIRFLPETVVLIGYDWLDTPKNRKPDGYATYDFTLKNSRHRINYFKATNRTPKTDAEKEIMELPGLFDDQGSCYATYDFLERFCDVRWYGASVLNIVFPKKSTLTVKGQDVRRKPAFLYRTDGVGTSFFGLWGDASEDAVQLYSQRMRIGGERWAGNHSFYSYNARFFKKSAEQPELFERKRPELFAKGQEGDDRQLCYTNPAVIQQAAQDARDYFDGKGFKGIQPCMGEYFSVVPMDHGRWCQCDNCQELLAIDKDNTGGGFASGTASHYFFNFVNKVAKEVKKTHPDKFISTLAYHVYSYYPEQIKLESNVAVAPCLLNRNYWPILNKYNDIKLYKRWVADKDRRVYIWNYHCFPNQMGMMGDWNVFPGFSAHTLDEQYKMYHEDGVRGVFLCGIGEQLDYYLTLKLLDDPSIDIDELLGEFFSRYFGAASEPMKKFYLSIEEIFTNTENYPEHIRNKEGDYNQTEEMAWGYLGTDERMAELGKYIDMAQRFAVSDLEMKRVDLWKKGIWDYMVEGKKMYIAKQKK
ncbi:DUF4838 domain-containing protein [Planctomycetota bacterium]